MFPSLRGCASLALFLFAIGAVAQQHPVSSDQVWSQLAAGNQRFMTGNPAAHDLVAQRKLLTKTQHPQVAVLSCSDSRVPPELLFDAGLGELFVVRAAGENDDAMALGSLEYAVEHLGSSVIVVLGHQSCGAVSAACSGTKPESVNLNALLAPIAPSCAKVDRTKPQTLDLAVRDHVHSVAQDVLARSEILRHASEEGKLIVVEAYYSLDTGEITKLR